MNASLASSYLKFGALIAGAVSSGLCTRHNQRLIKYGMQKKSQTFKFCDTDRTPHATKKKSFKTTSYSTTKDILGMNF